MIPEIEGADEVVAWFGSWPSFHDGEIICLYLNRSGESLLKIHTWLMSNEVDEKGHFVLTKHAIVTFHLENITVLQIEGFNAQNVILGLRIERTETGWLVSMVPCFGLAGKLEAERIKVEVSPTKPTEVSSAISG